MPTAGQLKARQARFVLEYLIDLNATQAAIRAGYSAKTANVVGPRLLVNVRVGKAIAAGQAKRAEQTEITINRVLIEYAKIGFAEPVKGGLLKHADKLHALDSVAKHLGMFKERHEVTGRDGEPLVPPDTSKVALALLNILSRARPEPEDEPGG